MDEQADLCPADRPPGLILSVRSFKTVFPRWLVALTLFGRICTASLVHAEPAAFSPEFVAKLRDHAHRVVGEDSDYEALLASIGTARLVMLGEATHGSTEFHRERARLSERLIAEKGFDAIVLEAGWAPTLPVNAYVHGFPATADAASSLSAFREFPRWVWRNSAFATWLETLRTTHAHADREHAVSVYGMDLYGVAQAVAHVLDYLQDRDPGAIAGARRDYHCFAPYINAKLDPQLYGRDLAHGRIPSCARRTASRLTHMQRLSRRQGDDSAFAAWMSARSIAGAERYYRTLYTSGALASWNLRERFLAESLHILLNRHKKLIVWAHNTHQGDARATDQAAVGELSIGQLMREQLDRKEVFLVGMTTFSGTVRAGSGWGTRDHVRRLWPAIDGSWSHLLHSLGLPAFALVLRDGLEAEPALVEPRLDRSVGVTYLPDAEIENHYAHSSIAHRFDAVIHIDTTTAVQPIP